MFVTLLVIDFFVAVAVCFVIVRMFRTPVDRILQRLVSEDIYSAWSKYIQFAIYVVGVSGGVRIWDLERYIAPRSGEAQLDLTGERWVLELYQAAIGTLQSDAWMLLLFFVFALVAFVIVKGLELRRQRLPSARPSSARRP